MKLILYTLDMKINIIVYGYEYKQLYLIKNTFMVAYTLCKYVRL